MKRSSRFEKIAHINQSIQNASGALFANVMSNYQFHENRLKHLRIYREEYQDRLNSKMQESLSVSELQDYQYFFSSLEQAIEQQAEKVSEIAAELENAKSTWLKHKRDTDKISRAAENMRSLEYSINVKNEQKELDELNSRRHMK